jgi:hypothetical protein
MSFSDCSLEAPVAILEDIEPGFVYLQNCMDSARCGYEIFRALKEEGFRIVYAGSIDRSVLQKLESELKVSEFCVFTGYLSVGQINWVLRRSAFTMIFYRGISPNNWFCDPNRLYQAAALGVKVCVGKNPTMVHFVKIHDAGVVCNTDGSSITAIKAGIRNIGAYELTSGNKSQFIWESLDERLVKALSTC